MTEVRKCRSFFKDSAVYPWYELLSNAVGLWSVFLPLSAHKLMNEIVEESQKLANPIWQRYEQTGWYPFHEEVLKERKIEKKSLRLVNAAMPGLTFLRSIYGCFCRCRSVYLPLYLPCFKWARSTLEGWKISACSHLHCSPVFHIYLK